ncbi:MAG TPA: anti-sigma factor [Chloroflexota bacterium]|nr:anti-sigma factor [Chloroflexota bacterium]
MGTGEGGSSPREPSDHPQDLLPLYVLDQLEGREQRAVEAHVARCTLCAETVRELRESIGSLSLAAPPVQPPESAREALFRRVRDRASRPGTRGTSTEDTPPQRTLSILRSPTAGWAMSTVLCVLVALLGWQLAVTRSELGQLRQEIDTITRRTPLLALAEINRQGTRIVPLEGTDTARGASGLVFYEPEGRIAVAVIDDLPVLEPGRVYQLWLLRDSSPVSGGTFRVDQNGVGTLVVNAPNALETYTKIGITAEPAPGVPSPTGTIIASVSL